MLVVARLRTVPRASWRSAVGSALAVVAGQPSLWLLGALGFAGRGGLVLLALPIIVVPTPIEMRLLVGSNLGSSGFSPAFYGMLAIGGALVALLAVAGLAAAAYAEMAAFERLAADPETAEQRKGRSAVTLENRPRRSLFAGLLLIQLTALAALALAAMPLAETLVRSAYDEVQRPGMGGSLYSRMLDDAGGPFFVLLAVLVLVEMVSAMASRRLLVASFGLSPSATGNFALPRALASAFGGALLQPLHSPLRTLLSLVAVWTASLAVLLPVGWAIQAVWLAVRSTYLGASSVSTPEAMIGLIIVTPALAGIWAMALLLAGFAAALRATIWSVEALH
jgi:hypothetical protein